MSIKIAIIGAGVIGTTTALRLYEEFGHTVKISIFSDQFSPYTTGDISAGLWGPYLLGETPKNKILKWSEDTHKFFHELWKNGEASQAGICLQPITRLVNDMDQYDAFWKDIVFGLTALKKHQINRLNVEHESNYKSGIHFTSFTCEPLLLLPYLYKKLIQAGVRIENKRIESFDELKSFDLIINCAGLGAQMLIKNDVKLQPIRGQVIRIRAPWIFEVMLDDSQNGNYIIPNVDTVILGGTHQEGDYNTAVNEDDKKFIHDGCIRINKSIKRAPIVNEMVGLRPGRSSVRLERDQYTTSQGKVIPIIHNYGHGGSGVTLSYGCAIEVCEIVRDFLKETSTSKYMMKSKL